MPFIVKGLVSPSQMMMVAGGDGVVVKGDGVVGATEVLDDEDEILISVISEQFTAPTP